MEHVTLTRDGDIATIRIERPEAMNALSASVLGEIGEKIAELRQDPPRVVLVASAGEKVFVAGADISAMAGMSAEQARAFAQLGHSVFAELEALDSLVVAVVQGAALGGGCELVLACDLVIASEKARFGQPETNLGLLPGFAGCSRLLRRVGVGRARDLIYTGRMIGAAEALEWGLANRVVPAGELAEAAREWAGELAARPPLAVRRAKAAMAAAESSDARTAARVEIEGFAAVFTSEDTREGLAAFLDKRSPTFKGR